MTNQQNDVNRLNEMEIDVIGEVMNISMGAAATAMSTILDKKVNITTPRIEVIEAEAFEFKYLEPVIGVLINYVEGIDGSNMLLLREEDLKIILRHLLSMEPEDMLEFDEISMSAVCEIMNQMMGSAASALATFLGKVVNISPPEVMDTTNLDKVRELIAGDGGNLVSIKFDLNIEGLVQSEFISAMEPKLAKEIIKMSFGASEVDLEPLQPEIFASNEETPIGSTEPMAQYHEPIQGSQYSPPPIDQTPRREMPRQEIQAIPYQYKQLGDPKPTKTSMEENNLDLIMSVPIQITVELGKTRKKIRDIAELTLGNIVELDRQAGDQVDVVANGKLIARGDVVVVDDNYSVRITEIIKSKDSISELK